MGYRIICSRSERCRDCSTRHLPSDDCASCEVEEAPIRLNVCCRNVAEKDYERFREKIGRGVILRVEVLRDGRPFLDSGRRAAR